ncbi:hypothetical protein COC42_15780 [Sphingomonas spermidinifaciens]|uniref:DUF600 domain-containing protein n=1 Tax=Sphingomonas spermidinifaciens TaxID=1141889 RepID=A0A2A4B0J7_9SPHN|nr:hypothetical protein [Sphingomonas spermidinifaciens]PCD01590.1 hypothetical protein COC42_15780 [Sphingomonas spermidinifaciens]
MIAIEAPAMTGDAMEQATFDQQRADALIQEIGSEIVRGSKFASRPWERIVVVAEIADRKRLFGYVYWDGNQWEAATPDGFRALTLFQELQAATQVSGKAPWRKCLTRIDRATGKIDVEFDHDGKRWVPDMADPEGFARRLRATDEG